MSRRKLLPLLAALLLAALVALVGHSGDEGGGGSRGASVVRVVDGDTLVVAVDGGEERVRLIGIDTPESVKSGTPVQCFAEKASAFTKHLLDGRRVRLVEDVEERDRYGRMLAYVYRVPDDLFVNAELVRQGYARTATFPPNVRFVEEFAALARQAREAGRGLWSSC